jgi:hypothetical protein
MMTEMVPETSVNFKQLTRLRARDFINFSRHDKVSDITSLMWSQEPSTVPYHKPDESSPYHPILFLKVPS